MSSSLCSPLQVNPDVSGVGVRVAIYLQVVTQLTLQRIQVLSRATPSAQALQEESHELIMQAGDREHHRLAGEAQAECNRSQKRERDSGARWTLIGLSTALTVAGVVTGIQRQITFLDAAILTNLVFIPDLLPVEGADLFYTCPYWLWQESDQIPPIFPWGFLLSVFDWLRSAFAIAFGLWVWVTASTFGATPECNGLTKIVVFFYGFKADKGAWHNFLLASWSLSGLAFLGKTIRTLQNIVRHKELKGLSRMERAARLEALDANLLNIASRTATTDHTFVKHFGPWFVIVSVVSVVVWTELLLYYNRVSSGINSEWSFGQVLPLTLAVLDFLRMCEVLWNHRM